MAAVIAKHLGARHIVVTDVNPYRLSLAWESGAILTVDVSRETVEDAQKILGMKRALMWPWKCQATRQH
jgi:threonine 3-dehydrogenase